MSVSVPDLCSILFHSLATRQNVQVYLKAPHKKVFRCRSKDQKKPYYTTITQQQARSTHVPHWHWRWHFMYVQFRTSRVKVSSFMSHVSPKANGFYLMSKTQPSHKERGFQVFGFRALGSGSWVLGDSESKSHQLPTPQPYSALSHY